MAEYIKREDAYNCLREKWKAAESREDIFEADTVRQDAVEISNLPTVDAVEVVHCKDCEYSIEVKESDSIICRHPSQHSTYERTSDDYCSFGKRKEQEHD